MVKKFFAGLALVLGFLVGGIPAGANFVEGPSLNCERVTFTYRAFPSAPVDIYVEVKMSNGEGAIFAGKVKTTGEEGAIKVPIDIPVSGDVRLFIQWFVDGEHHLVQHFMVNCGEVVTTTSTTTIPAPPTTVVTTPPSSVPALPPTTLPNPNPEPMPRTGRPLIRDGLYGLAAVGAGFLLVRRSRKLNEV